ncbi:MAG TPA: GNAT family N-acetyltransferase [Pyrinomonadaceae bacterium]|nr:GNAT family N-acetyltransferase [Pyrinomonadaceae bacterium]
MEIEIRLASENDAVTLARLRYELRSASHEVIENEQTFLARCAAWMNERLRQGSYWQCWIAEQQSIAVGAVWAQLVEKIPNPIAESEHYVYLTNFYVREAHRDQGLGSRLLMAVQEWAESKNAQMIILWPTERSKAFYLRHGFSFADDAMALSLNSK